MSTHEDAYNDFIHSVFDMPDTLLKAKILLLKYKEMARDYENIGYTRGHVFYRALAKMPVEMIEQAGKELPESPEIDYAIAGLIEQNS